MEPGVRKDWSIAMQDDRRDHEEEEKKGQESSGINWDDYLDDGAEVPASHYKERGKNPALKVALLAVLIVAVIAGVATAAPWIAKQLGGSGEQLDLPDPGQGDADSAQSNPARSEEGERADNRSQLEKLSDPDNRYTNFLLCGVDKSEALTDVILVASLCKDDNSVTLLQIPRDCYVGDQQVTGKINSIYGHNPSGENDISYLIDAIEQRLWIPIDHYAIINLATVRDVVDAIGGVPVTLPRDIYYKKNKILYAGDQVLNGEQAEWMIRYRKGYTTGDIGRLDMQKVFLKAFAQKVKSLGLVELGGLAQQFYNKIENDMSIGDILALVPAALGIDIDKVEILTVPGDGVMHNTYAIYSVNKEKTAELLNEYFWHGTTPLLPEDLDFPDVEVAPYTPPVQPAPQQEEPSQEDNELDEPLEEDGTEPAEGQDGQGLGPFLDDDGFQEEEKGSQGLHLQAGGDEDEEPLDDEEEEEAKPSGGLTLRKPE